MLTQEKPEAQRGLAQRQQAFWGEIYPENVPCDWPSLCRDSSLPPPPGDLYFPKILPLPFIIPELIFLLWSVGVKNEGGNKDEAQAGKTGHPAQPHRAAAQTDLLVSLSGEREAARRACPVPPMSTFHSAASGERQPRAGGREPPKGKRGHAKARLQILGDLPTSSVPSPSDPSCLSG